MSREPEWKVTASTDPSDGNDLVYLTATRSDVDNPLYAAARVTKKRQRIVVELSEWQNEDGVTVDLPRLTAKVKKDLRGNILKPGIASSAELNV